MKKTFWTKHARDRFLAYLAESGIVSESCKACGMSRALVYSKRQEKSSDGTITASAIEFARLWDEAELVAADMLEREARRRAIDGIEDYVVSRGEVVMFDAGDGKGPQPLKRRVYSDALLALLLRARNPSVFGDRQKIEHSGEMTISSLSERANEMIAKELAKGRRDE